MDHSDLLGWLTVNGLFRIAVPTFLIINGYFFFEAIERKGAILPWLRRIFILYAFWMIVFSPLWGEQANGVGKVIQFAVFGWFHLWYIAGMLLAGPLLYSVRDWSDRKLLNTALFVFIIGVVLQYLAAFQVFSGMFGEILDWNGSHRNFLLYSFPFMALGYLLRRREARGLRLAGARKFLALSFVCLLIEVLAIYFLTGGSKLSAASRGTIDNYFSLLFVAPFLFLTVKEAQVLSERFRGKWLSNISSGIYFTHPIFLIWLGFGSMLSETFATAVVLLCSTLLAVITAGIPKLSRWIL